MYSDEHLRSSLRFLIPLADDSRWLLESRRILERSIFRPSAVFGPKPIVCSSSVPTPKSQPNSTAKVGARLLCFEFACRNRSQSPSRMCSPKAELCTTCKYTAQSAPLAGWVGMKILNVIKIMKCKRLALGLTHGMRYAAM